MAKSPKNVASMYESLIPKLQKAAEVEKIELAINKIITNLTTKSSRINKLQSEKSEAPPKPTI